MDLRAIDVCYDRLSPDAEHAVPSAPTLSELNAGTIFENIRHGYVMFCGPR